MIEIKKIKKRGQIGETITWFSATIIIFFLVIAFVLLSGFIAGGKFISGEQIGKKETDINLNLNHAETQRELFYFLNSFSEEGIEIKNLIIYWSISDDTEIKNKIISESETFFGNLRNNELCHLLRINEEPFYLVPAMRFDEGSGRAEMVFYEGNQKINIVLRSTSKCPRVS